MDTYLCVVLGRPKHFHDEDIDQTLPESVIDEEITSDGPKSSASENDSLIDGLVHHSRLAQLLGAATRDVYSVRRISRQARMAAVDVLRRQLRQWKDRLPPHLGTVPCVCSCEHAYLPAFAFGERKLSLGQCCVRGSRMLGSSADRNGDDQRNNLVAGNSREDLMELAERCQHHLSDSNSSSRRYAIVLDELLREAKRTRNRGLQRVPNNLEQRECSDSMQSHDKPAESQAAGANLGSQQAHQAQADLLDLNGPFDEDYNFLDEWSISDWLELDSSYLRIAGRQSQFTLRKTIRRRNYPPVRL
ncbi:hypothetical protein KC328_g10 [Hortaea werneckii]|nr:hypothetical protein KC328_g10 [Hortaea werneckii]